MVKASGHYDSYSTVKVIFLDIFLYVHIRDTGYHYIIPRGYTAKRVIGPRSKSDSDDSTASTFDANYSNTPVIL